MFFIIQILQVEFMVFLLPIVVFRNKRSIAEFFELFICDTVIGLVVMTAVEIPEIHDHVFIDLMKSSSTVDQWKVESDPGEVVVAFEIIELVIKTVDHAFGGLLKAQTFFLSVDI